MAFISSRLKGAIALAMMCVGASFCLGEARAQEVFCPQNINPPAVPQPAAGGGGLLGGGGGGPVAVPRGGIAQARGTCTNGKAGAFSGAALASQSLGNLASTTTQLETTTASRALAGRRADAGEACAPDQRKINGVCVSTRQPAPVVYRRVVKQPATTVMVKKVVVIKKVAQSPRVTGAAKIRKVRVVVRRRVVAPAVVENRPEVVPQGGVFYDGTRYGAWVQGYGDYERRTGSQSSSFICCNIPGQAPIPLTLYATSRTTTYGFVGGIDWAARSLFGPNDGIVVGLLAGYMHSEVDVDVATISRAPLLAASGSSHITANLDGPSLGAYASYYKGPFSNDFLIKNDFLSLGETNSGTLGFGICTCFGATDSSFTGYSTGAASTRLNLITISDYVNYRVPLTAVTWLEPTGGVQYTKSLYDSSAGVLGLRDGDAVRLQAGLRYGVTGVVGGHLLTTSVTGLVFNDVLVRGNFIQGGVFGFNGNILNDQGRFQGEGILAVNYELGGGYSTFAQADVRGGDQIFGVGGRAGVRLRW